MSGYVARQKSKQPKKKILNSKSDAKQSTSDDNETSQAQQITTRKIPMIAQLFVEALGQSLRIVRWRSDAADMDSPVRG